MTSLLRERGLDVDAFDFRPDETEPGPRPLARYPEITAYIETSDPAALPFEDDRYDAVLSCGVLEHVGDPEASLGEIRRILKPGGTFYVYKLPNRRSYLEAIAKRMGLYYHGAWPDDRVYDLPARPARARGLRGPGGAAGEPAAAHRRRRGRRAVRRRAVDRQPPARRRPGRAAARDERGARRDRAAVTRA